MMGFSQSYFTIEDENFTLYLNQSYPSVIDGNRLNLSSPRLLEIREMKLNGLNIHSLEGIQYFSSLRSLECIENNLKSLPELPKKLERLDCSMNQLSALPDLPSNLEELSCADNLLTQLPDLPISLKVLYCNFNQLTILPNLPSNLEYLSCGTNQLKCLPELPSSIFMGDITVNPINCLPSYEMWMDDVSLELPICARNEEATSPHECVCVVKSIVSNQEEKEEVSEMLVSNNLEVKVFPNPVKQNVIISSETVINSITIVNMNGQVVNSTQVNDTQIELNIQSYQNGIYFIHSNFDDKIVTSKVIKVQ